MLIFSPLILILYVSTRTSHQLLRLVPLPIFIDFFLKTPFIGKSWKWNRKRIRIKFRGFQTLLSESLFYSKLMTRWTFPINIVSVFFSNVKLSFLNHCAQVVVSNSDFFNKNDDFYFKTKKKFPDSTDLLNGWMGSLPGNVQYAYFPLLQ